MAQQSCQWGYDSDNGEWGQGEPRSLPWGGSLQRSRPARAPLSAHLSGPAALADAARAETEAGWVGAGSWLLQLLLP